MRGVNQVDMYCLLNIGDALTIMTIILNHAAYSPVYMKWNNPVSNVTDGYLRSHQSGSLYVESHKHYHGYYSTPAE